MNRYDLDNMAPHGGRIISENGETINLADELRDGLRWQVEIRDSETVMPQDGADLPLVSTYGPALLLYVSAAATVTIRKASGGLQRFEGIAPGSFQKMPPYVGVESTGTNNDVQIIAGY